MAGTMTNAQRAKIYAVCREQAIDNDLLHELVYAETGCSSLKNLSSRQALQVIDRLEGRSTPKGMATPKQKRFLEALLKEVGWVLEDDSADWARLEAFIQNQYKVDSLKWLTSKTAGKAIEALKDMKARMKKPALQGTGGVT